MTLLGFIMTDAAVSPMELRTALDCTIDRSFNPISVDGGMSTKGPLSRQKSRSTRRLIRKAARSSGAS